MAAIDLNTVRSTIEGRLATELASSPAIPVVFNNMTFDSTAEDTFVQCVTSFGNNSYLTQGGSSDSDNQIDGLVWARETWTHAESHAPQNCFNPRHAKSGG